MNRIKESQPWAGFSWFICNVFEEKKVKKVIISASPYARL